MASIQLTGIGKQFGDTIALRDIDLAIADGEFIVFVGPSGCGKSTLLRIIAGLEEPTNGQIAIDGKEVTRTPATKRGLSMVFQSYGLYPHMTVRDNMAFGLKMAKLPAADIERRVNAAAETLQLNEHLHKKPRQLSGGQRQRVAIGRAIVREPCGFLFDEPLSNLDAALRVQMRLEIVQLQRHLATTAIYVTHDQIEAMTMASRIVVLNRGQIEQIGAPLELYNRPANRFVAGFIGSPKMNFISDDTVTLGIRPEHLSLAADGAGDWSGEIENAEHLGADTILHIRCPQIGLLTARIADGKQHHIGERVHLAADRQKLHRFDDTGAALPPIP